MNPCPSSLPLNGPFIPKGEWSDFPTARSIRARDKTTIYYPPGCFTPMEELTPAERASLSYVWDPAAPLLNRPTLPIQAAMRIRWWAQWKRSLAETRGLRMVSYVQAMVWSRPAHYPWMGYELIRLVDATAHQHGVYVYIGAQRLTERLEELGWLE